MLIDVIKMPLAYGCDIAGVENGPDRLISAGLLNTIEKYYPLGEIDTVSVKQVQPEQKYHDHPHLKYLRPIVLANQQLRNQALASLKKQNFPLIIGGDHALALGSLAAQAAYDPETLVIWVDAHGDINTDQTTITGNIHGMPLASAFNWSDPKLDQIFQGRFLKPANLIYLGVRSLDAGELALIKQHQITHYTAQQINTAGVVTVMDEVLSQIKQKQPTRVHLSFDIDVLDALLVPGTGTKEPHGLSLTTANYILTKLAQSKLITSMDFVEFNPTLDQDNLTLETALYLLENFFKNYQLPTID